MVIHRTTAYLVLAGYLLAIACAVSAARADPGHGRSASVGVPPRTWHAPAWWLAQAACIRGHEGWPTAATGNGYEGSYQFLRSTWESVGGRTDASGHWASVAPLSEQTFRAYLVWRRDGGSWREWGTAGMCGLR